MIYHLPTLTPAADPLTAADPAGRMTTAPADWWAAAYPDEWRALLRTAGYAVGADDDPAPYGLGPPVIEADADGQMIVRRYALPDPDQRTAAERLADLRAERHAERRRLRQAGIDSGAPLPGGEILDSDLESRVLLTGACALAQTALMQGTAEALAAYSAGLGAGWRARSGAVVATDAAGMLALAGALAAHVAAWDAASQQVRTAIDACATEADLAALSLTGTWPADAGAPRGAP